jgi:hypothetical protein
MAIIRAENSDNQRAKTLIERLGFNDADLKNPKHDDIMMWLDAYLREKVANQPQKHWSPERITALRKCGLPIDEPDDPEVILEIKWEYPVMNKQYLVGFIDLVSQLTTSVGLSVDNYYHEGILRHEWECAYRTNTTAYEVKSTMPTAGEVIRQVNTYRQYTDITHWCVVAPRCDYVDILTAQEIDFLQFPGGVK